MVHEHPGVYSSYDASSVIGGKKTARILGAAAVSTTGTANEVVTLTSYAEGVSAFGEDAEGTVGMAALLAALYRNGAAVVKAVKVSAATPTGYEAAFAALEQEAVDVIVCDSTSVDVQLKLRASVEKASGAQRERIGVVSGGASETAAKLVERAGKLNSERMVLTAPGGCCRRGHRGGERPVRAGERRGARGLFGPERELRRHTGGYPGHRRRDAAGVCER